MDLTIGHYMAYLILWLLVFINGTILIHADDNNNDKIVIFALFVNMGLACSLFMLTLFIAIDIMARIEAVILNWP